MKKLFAIIKYFLLIIFTLPLLYFTFRKDNIVEVNDLRAKYETKHSKYLMYDNRQIHYFDKGEGSPILFLHGFGGSFLNWQYTWRELEDEYRIIAVDLPGFGLSDLAIDSLEKATLLDYYSDAVSALIDELKLDSFYLVGNSLGGYLSMEVAVRHSEEVEKLVLVDAFGFDVDKIGNELIKLSGTRLFQYATQKGIPKWLSRKAAENSAALELEEEEIQTYHELLNRHETIHILSKLGQNRSNADTSRFELVDAPTLIIWGEKDKVIPVNHALRFNNVVCNSEVLLYPEIGHVPMVETPKRFAKDITDFFKL